MVDCGSKLLRCEEIRLEVFLRVRGVGRLFFFDGGGKVRMQIRGRGSMSELGGIGREPLLSDR